MTTIHTLDAADQRLLSVYSEIDRRSGAAFADADCVELVDDWRGIATAEIARAARRELVLCTSPDGWSLHVPGSTDEDIACGDAAYLACGDGRPSDDDYCAAWLRHVD